MVAFFWQYCIDTYVLFEVTLTCWIIITRITITFKIRHGCNVLFEVKFIFSIEISIVFSITIHGYIHAVIGHVPMLNYLHIDNNNILIHPSCCLRWHSFVYLSSHSSVSFYEPSLMGHIPAVWGRVDDWGFHGTRVTWI